MWISSWTKCWDHNLMLCLAQSKNYWVWMEQESGFAAALTEDGEEEQQRVTWWMSELGHPWSPALSREDQAVSAKTCCAPLPTYICLPYCTSPGADKCWPKCRNFNILLLLPSLKAHYDLWVSSCTFYLCYDLCREKCSAEYQKPICVYKQIHKYQWGRSINSLSPSVRKACLAPALCPLSLGPHLLYLKHCSLSFGLWLPPARCDGLTQGPWHWKADF